MKKTIILLLMILVLAYGILSLLGSRGEYSAERVFYRAFKNVEKIAKNPDVIPPALFSSAEKDLQDLQVKYPKTEVAKKAPMFLVEFYIMSKRYDKALDTLDSIIMKAGADDIRFISQAHLIKGNIYEKKKEPEKALKEYELIRDQYAETPLGMQMPLYIGNYYNREGREAEAQEAYSAAVSFYKKTAQQQREKPIGYMASSFLVQSYILLKEYEEAGRALEDLFKAYPLPLTYMQHLPKVEFIYIRMLDMPEKACQLYTMARDNTDNVRLKEFLTNRIESIEKDKKAEVE